MKTIKLTIYELLKWTIRAWLIIPGVLSAQQSTTIKGPGIVKTPFVALYSINLPNQFQVQWSVNLNSGIAINGPSNRPQVSIGFIGRGVDTLTATIYPTNNPTQTILLRFKIKKNDCSAIIGFFDRATIVACKRKTAALKIDTLSGDSIEWQSSYDPRSLWTVEKRIPIPVNQRKNYIYNTIAIHQAIYYRAIVYSNGCTDTSSMILVLTDNPADGGFKIKFPNRKFCTGAITPPLAAELRNGKGRWKTNGKGSFTDIFDPMARYRIATSDGRDSIIHFSWVIANGLCDTLVYTDSILVRTAPRAVPQEQNKTVCPGRFSEKFKIFNFSGRGSWQIPFDFNGKISDIYTPDAILFPSLSDAGKSYRFEWKTGNGICDSVYIINVNVAPAKVANIKHPKKQERYVYCSGEAVGFEADTTGRLGAYFWSSNQAAIQNANRPFAVAFPIGDSAAIYMSFTDFQTGCITYDTVMIFKQQIAPIFTGKEYTICVNESVRLEVIGMDTIAACQWEKTEGLSETNIPNPIFTPTEGNQTYRIKVKGRALNNGCDSETIVSIKVLPYQTADIRDVNNRVPNVFCSNYPNSIKIINTETCKRWMWFSGDRITVKNAGNLNESNPYYAGEDTLLSIRSLPARNIPYTFCAACISRENDCLYLKDFNFEVLPVPTPGFKLKTKTIPYSDRSVRFENITIGAENYSWDFGDPSTGDNNNSQSLEPEHFFIRPGRYLITLVANNNACSKSFTDTIRILSEEYYFPNTFSPNGDQKNDIFRPIPAFWNQSDIDPIKETEIILFQIYNLRGNLIFEIDSKMMWKEKLGWDGKNIDGKPVESGTYLYNIVIDQEPKGSVTHKGYIQLIR